jgi:hypothetical protein
MKAKFLLFASALLLASGIAGAQEQKTPTEEQQAPTAKVTAEDMMGHTGQRMMGRGMMHKGIMRGMHMRLILILMDADGDGALSLEEFQEAHARIFKGIDADKDGKVTQTEMQTFFGGGSPTPDREFDDAEDDD